MSHIQTQAEWEEEMAEKILKFVHHELYLDLRYMEPALSALAYKKTDGLLTFATDGMVLYFSTEMLLRVFKKNAKFLDRVYLHCVLHCLFKHLWIGGQREKRLWNTACDIAVEYVIDSMEKASTKRILSWIRKDTYDKITRENHLLTAAGIYQWLKGMEEERFEALAKEFYTDDHRFWPTKEQMKMPLLIQTRQNWEKTARQVTLEMGRKSDTEEESAKQLAIQIAAAKNRRSYRDFLRKFSVLEEERHFDEDAFDLGYYSYGLRIYGNLPLIEPLETREAYKIREFIIVIDTSESTSGALVQGFLEETFSILSQKNSFFETFSIRILQCDNRVQKDVLVKNWQEFERMIAEFQIAGGGGTDFRPAFSYVEELRKKGELKRPCGLFYFTDGKGIYPKKKPDYKTAFLFLEDYDEEAVPPWAMRLRLDAEEWMDEHQTGKRRNQAYRMGLS